MKRRFGRAARSGVALLLAALICVPLLPVQAFEEDGRDGAVMDVVPSSDKPGGVTGGVTALSLDGGVEGVPEFVGDDVNVEFYNAVGDAKYHHHFADLAEPDVSEYRYRTGYYSVLEEKTCEKNGLTYLIPDEDEDESKSKSKRATDNSEEFEKAIEAGGGKLFLPEGDYVVSQLTAAKIKSISGPGRIWLKEWNGGDTWYYLKGLYDSPLTYSNDGWIDAAHFNDETWREMHWITDLPEAGNWSNSEQFKGNISPRSEFVFDRDRDQLNMWLTIRPAVSNEDDFGPDEITVCISGAAVKYTTAGNTVWNENKAYDAGLQLGEGAMFDPNWNEETKKPVPMG